MGSYIKQIIYINLYQYNGREDPIFSVNIPDYLILKNTIIMFNF